MPAKLAHLPGPRPTPFIGHTLDLVRDAYGMHARARARHGDVYAIRIVGVEQAALHGADAIEAVLMDPDRRFSSFGGWKAIRGLFRGGLMLRDFDDHRRHRRIMNVAFKSGAMRDYSARMDAAMADQVAGLPQGRPTRLHPLVKENTLRMGAAVLMGLDHRAPEARSMNADFMAQISAALAPIRTPLPPLAMWRGLRARDRQLARFRGLIADRRAAGGDDFFSRMCQATDEDGSAWTEAEIADHFNFLLLAAYDTTASTIAGMVGFLARHPEWQQALAGEVASLGDGPLDADALERMELTRRVFRETLRLCPPVPFIPREVVKPFSWGGYDIPVGAGVVVLPGVVMRSPDYWSDPMRFDPDRFSPERAEDRRHRFAWAPFGGGAHKCIGMHFSLMEARLFIAHLLRRVRVLPAASHPSRWRHQPIPRPLDGLPVRLEPVRHAPRLRGTAERLAA